MAEAITLPTSNGGAPAAAPVATPVVQPDHAPVQQQSGQATGLGGVDPSRLPPELQEIYRSLQGDYTRKTTEIAEERKKHANLEQQFKDLDTRVKRYSEQERIWQQWTPFLQTVAQPGVMDRIQAVLQGKPVPTAQSSQTQTGEQTVARLLDGIGDDDYVNGAMLDRGLKHLKDVVRQELLAESRQEFQNYGQQAVRGLTEWVQNYMTLADEMLGLRLQHQYGLTPREGSQFDPSKVVETARQFGITNLPAAYQLAYGKDEAARMAAMATQSAATEREQIEKEAYERGMREAQVRFQSQQSGIIPPDGAQLPKFNANGRPTYATAEKELNDRMSALNLGRR